VFRWLSWSEAGFFYFTGGLLTLLFSANAITNSIAIVALLNILALPYTVFSVYYQWRVAKQWCVLCLAVQVILIVGVINVLANSFLFPFPLLSASYLIKVTLLYLLPVLIWFAVKPYVLRLQEARNTKREYLRIKFNAEIFDMLLTKQKAMTLPIDSLGIDLGNPAATNILIKVCNPYCGPCAKAHPKIDKLLKENKNLRVKIIFTASNSPKHPAIKPVRHLLALAEEFNEIKTKKALDAWYLAETKDYERFAAKYPKNGELLKQGDKIEAMDKWCKVMDIRFTPTIFINGYELPDSYDVNDLQYFLLE
jgi:thiol-disulfide isomerase/thioredoxin